MSRSVEDEATLAVPMVDPEVVQRMRAFRALGWSLKRIAAELGIARNSVRRYVRQGTATETQLRRGAWTLGEEERARARALLEGPAAGNGVVVQRLLAEERVPVPLRTLQRVLAPYRQERRAAELATVRFETAPGHQMQIDFGEKLVGIAGSLVRVFLFVAVLGYSRRIYVRASLSQRQDDWREGLAGAFLTFGGVPQEVLIDRAGALVLRGKGTGSAFVHPAFAAFCKEWGVHVSVCRPYSARTKGKTESGVGYVKRNALASLCFESFAGLETHLAQWMVEADQRIHGTTHERPAERFERDEHTALQPLPAVTPVVRERRLQRRVSTDCFVDVDTIRYSVPHRFVRRTLDVLVSPWPDDGPGTALPSAAVSTPTERLLVPSPSSSLAEATRPLPDHRLEHPVCSSLDRQTGVQRGELLAGVHQHGTHCVGKPGVFGQFRQRRQESIRRAPDDDTEFAE